MFLSSITEPFPEPVLVTRTIACGSTISISRPEPGANAEAPDPLLSGAEDLLDVVRQLPDRAALPGRTREAEEQQQGADTPHHLNLPVDIGGPKYIRAGIVVTSDRLTHFRGS